MPAFRIKRGHDLLHNTLVGRVAHISGEGTDVAHHDGDVGVGAGAPYIGGTEVPVLAKTLQSPRAEMPEQRRGEDLVILLLEHPPPARPQDRAVDRADIGVDKAADLNAEVRFDLAQQPRLVPDLDFER